MGSYLSRSVKIRISNKTRNITLRNPRTYFYSGRHPGSLLPELFPGSSDTCHFPGRSPLWGVTGILVYEAEAFTLAIYFSNPIDYSKYTMKLGLELSRGRAHLGSLVDTYTRMANSTHCSADLDIKSDHGMVSKNNETVQVSDGPIKVTATMSSDTHSLLCVVLEEEEELWEKAEIENSYKTRHVQEK